MYIYKSRDKINKSDVNKFGPNFQKMFKTLKQNSISRPTTQKTRTKSRRPVSMILKTQQLERSGNKQLRSGDKNHHTSLKTFKKLNPHPLSTTGKDNLNLYLVTNLGFRKVYDLQTTQQMTNHFRFMKNQTNNPQNTYKRTILKSYKKKVKHNKFRKSDLDVRIQGLKIF